MTAPCLIRLISHTHYSGGRTLLWLLGPIMAWAEKISSLEKLNQNMKKRSNGTLTMPLNCLRTIIAKDEHFRIWP